ncbi:MAG: hypothetical protein U1F77_11445 [Kiritimatiellia bacterium]
MGLRKLTITTAAVTLTAAATDHRGAALDSGDYTAAWTNVGGSRRGGVQRRRRALHAGDGSREWQYVVRLTATQGLESVTQDYEITAQLTPRPPAF